MIDRASLRGCLDEAPVQCGTGGPTDHFGTSAPIIRTALRRQFPLAEVIQGPTDDLPGLVRIGSRREFWVSGVSTLLLNSDGPSTLGSAEGNLLPHEAVSGGHITKMGRAASRSPLYSSACCWLGRAVTGAVHRCMRRPLKR